MTFVGPSSPEVKYTSIVLLNSNVLAKLEILWIKDLHMSNRLDVLQPLQTYRIKRSKKIKLNI